MSVYERLMRGESVSWRGLDEQGKYEVWSAHIDAGGAPFTYPAFCEYMDQRTSSANLTIGY